MGEREQLAADTAARLRKEAGAWRQLQAEFSVPGSEAHGLYGERVDLLTTAADLLEPEEPARPEQCPTCGTTNADGWVQVQYDSGEWSRELEPCPDPWHFGGEQ